MLSAEQMFVAWQELVRNAYWQFKAARLNELMGKRSKFLDGRGLHPLSLVVGEIHGLQLVMPELRELQFDPVLMRKQAERDAEEEFRQSILKGEA